MVHIIRQRAEPEQMRQMLEALGIYIMLKASSWLEEANCTPIAR